MPELASVFRMSAKSHISLQDSYVSPLAAYEEMTAPRDASAESGHVIKGVTKLMYVGTYVNTTNTLRQCVCAGPRRPGNSGKNLKTFSSQGILIGLTSENPVCERCIATGLQWNDQAGNLLEQAGWRPRIV